MLKWSTYLLFGLLSLVVAQNEDTGSMPLAESGSSNEPAPYLVYLEVNGVFLCGGSMISQSHVLTTAKGLRERAAHSLTVVGGVNKLNGRGFKRTVKKVIYPNGYEDDIHYRDLAVVKLQNPMPSTVIPLPLCSSQIQIGDTVRISGWGTTLQDGTLSNELRTLDRPVIRLQKCIDAYNHIEVDILPSMFCTLNLNNTDTCHGDTGGAIVRKNELCGIVSWGPSCALRGFPGVNTNVFNMRDFILRAMIV